MPEQEKHRELVQRFRLVGDRKWSLEPRVVESYCGKVEVLRAGYDKDGSPLGRPVHWSIERRGPELLYRSRFTVSRGDVLRTWGEAGLQVLGPDREEIEVTLETELPSTPGSERSEAFEFRVPNEGGGMDIMRFSEGAAKEGVRRRHGL